MARINLLPWRAERRRQRQKERNDYLRGQITQLDAKIEEIKQLDLKKQKLLARKDVIEKLQANRSQMVHLFDSLVRTIPDGVTLTSIQQNGEMLTLKGRSQSNARVSTYMRNLEGSGWMTSPELSVIEARGDNKGLPYEFDLTVKLANPNAPVDANNDGVPDAPVTPVATPVDVTAPAAAGTAAAPAAGTAPAPTPATAPAAPAPAAPASSQTSTKPATGAAP